MYDVRIKAVTLFLAVAYLVLVARFITPLQADNNYFGPRGEMRTAKDKTKKHMSPRDHGNDHDHGGPKGNNGVGNGLDPQPPGNPPINDGPGTGPGNPGNKGGRPSRP